MCTYEEEGGLVNPALKKFAHTDRDLSNARGLRNGFVFMSGLFVFLSILGIGINIFFAFNYVELIVLLLLVLALGFLVLASWVQTHNVRHHRKDKIEMEKQNALPLTV